ncbi:hypothetical protein KFE25_001064 [Diacronema lutheri]|uniref:Peroxin-7 n=2 Tax=Diacronema lutheri TaxID=2081491 RepID=A0A8J5XEP2_DIALT|nr:hypothetical protein KFE25_001064 [Diacronema lutheri]
MLLAQVSAAPAGCQVWSHNVLAAHGRRFAYIGTLSIYVYAADADGSYGLEKVLNGPDEVMGGVSWSPLDASRLVVTVADHLVVWDVDMGVEAQRIRVDGVYSVGWAAHSPHILASGVRQSAQGQLRFHDVRTGSSEVVHSMGATPTVLRWHRSMPRLAVGAASGQVALVVSTGVASLRGVTIAWQLSTRDKSPVTDLAWDPLSDSYLLCASAEGEILLIDAANAKAPVLQAFATPDAQPRAHTSIGWLPGVPGSFVSTSSMSVSAKVWNASLKAHSEVIRLDRASDDAVHALIFLRDSTRRALVSFRSGAVGVYDFEKRFWHFTASAGHTDTIFGAVFHPRSPDIFATASFDGTARIWELGALAGCSEPLSVATLHVEGVSSGGGHAVPHGTTAGATAVRGSNSALFDLGTIPKGTHLPGPNGRTALYAIAFEPTTGDRLAGGTGGGALIIWELATGRAIVAVQVSAGERTLYSVDWCAPDESVLPGGLIGCASADGHAYALDARGRRVFAAKQPSGAVGFSWCPTAPHVGAPAAAGGTADGAAGGVTIARFAVATVDGEVRVYDVARHDAPSVPAAGGAAPNLVAGGTTARVRVVEPPAFVLFGHSARAFSVVWSPLVRDRLLSGSDDRTARVWDVSAGASSADRCDAVLRGHSAHVRAVHWSAELPWLALTGGWDGQLAVWDVRGGGQLLCSRFEHTVDVYAISSHALRPFVFVSTSRDNTVRVWSAADALQPTVAAVALGAAGERLAPWALGKRAASGLPALSGSAPPPMGANAHALADGAAPLSGAGSEAARSLVAAAAASERGAPSVGSLLALTRFVMAPGAVGSFLNLVGAHAHGTDVPPDQLHVPVRAQLANAAATIEALRADGRSGVGAGGVGASARGARRQLVRHGVSRLALSASTGASSLSHAPVGGARVRRDERAALVEAHQLRLGRFREWCDAQAEAGNWAGALAAAPAVSAAYWAEVAVRYARHGLERGEPLEVVAPALLAAGGADVLVRELLARGQFNDAALIAAAAAAGAYPPAPPAPPAPAAAAAGPPPRDAPTARTDGAGGAAVSPLELSVVVRAAAAHLSAAEPIDAACAFLTLPAGTAGAVDAAIGCLLSAHQPELALATCALLAGAPELRAHAAWLVGMRCERHGAWELGAAALASAGGAQARLRALCARARLCAPPGRADDGAWLSAQHGVAPAVEQLSLADAAEQRGELAAAIAHAALAGRDGLARASALALAALRAGVAADEAAAAAAERAAGGDVAASAAGSSYRRAARGLCGALWDARDACRALPLDAVEPAVRARLLRLVAYAACADAAARGFAPVLPALYDAAVDGGTDGMAEGAGGAAPLARALRALALACADTIRSARGAFNSTARAEAAVRQMRAALPASVLRDGEGEDGAERTLGALADELAAAAVASAVSDGGWRASAAAATAAAAEQPSAGARAHDADPLAVPGHACVRAYGVTLPSSGHPRMNGVVSLFDGHRVRGEHVTLDDGLSAISASDAIMWATVHPYSPLGTGRLFNPF